MGEIEFCEDHGRCICGNDCTAPEPESETIRPSNMSMSHVLETHRLGHTIGYAVHCVCDPETGYSPDMFFAHQARELARAGFGSVRAGAEVGWDAAVGQMTYTDGTPVEIAENINPFRNVG